MCGGVCVSCGVVCTCCGVVLWCGVVLCGVELWCGVVVWCCFVWCGVVRLGTLSLSLSLALFSFFWTRNERAPSGVTSEATQHCCENNCHNIHHCDETERSLWTKTTQVADPKLSSKRNVANCHQRDTGTKATDILHSV